MSTVSREKLPSSQAEIVDRLIRPEQADLSPQVAEGLLRIRFETRDLDRMHELAVKGQDGILEPDEHQEIENYRQVGYLLDLIHSKARRSLKSGQPGR